MGPPASALCPLPPASAFKTSIGRASAPGGGRGRSAQAAENPPMCPNLIDLSTNTVKFEGFASFCRMCPGWISRKIHSNSNGFAYFLLDFAGFAGLPEKYRQISRDCVLFAGCAQICWISRKIPSNLKGLRTFKFAGCAWIC